MKELLISDFILHLSRSCFHWRICDYLVGNTSSPEAPENVQGSNIYQDCTSALPQSWNVWSDSYKRGQTVSFIPFHLFLSDVAPSKIVCHAKSDFLGFDPKLSSFLEWEWVIVSEIICIKDSGICCLFFRSAPYWSWIPKRCFLRLRPLVIQWWRWWGDRLWWLLFSPCTVSRDSRQRALQGRNRSQQKKKLSKRAQKSPYIHLGFPFSSPRFPLVFSKDAPRFPLAFL